MLRPLPAAVRRTSPRSSYLPRIRAGKSLAQFSAHIRSQAQVRSVNELKLKTLPLESTERRKFVFKHFRWLVSFVRACALKQTVHVLNYKCKSYIKLTPVIAAVLTTEKTLWTRLTERRKGSSTGWTRCVDRGTKDRLILFVRHCLECASNRIAFCILSRLTPQSFLRLLVRWRNTYCGHSPSQSPLN